ncbi:Imm21 family immunity protein [Sphaerisporangium krabiense]|uniref:Imm21 family immunity protein n=1 Tax=Sphaerisporangium krabiense TaxID=763782 RepID=UPI001614663D|nr:Imm21 family immunity protein [Sphaerisporangium krabiense]
MKARPSVLHTWVRSAGGPLIAVPESELNNWAGVDDNDGPVETWGDYGRACAVEGYIGLVVVGAQRALVLGDEPAMTTFLATERLFVRWAGADSETELIAAARRTLAGEPDWDDDEDLIWEARESVVLFDSAIPGAESEPDDRLVIDLDPGRYRVRATYTKDEDNWMILVHLQPTT